MARARVAIISEVPASRTEGSERLITDIMEALGEEGWVLARRIRVGRWERWRASFGKLDVERPSLIHFYPIGSLTLGALVRAWLWRRRSITRSVLLHAFQARRSEARVPAWLLRACLGSQGGVVTQSWRLAVTLRGTVPVFFVPPAVDARVFRPPTRVEREEARRALGIRDGEQVLLHVGHLRRTRNLSVLCQLRAIGLRVIMVASPRLPADSAVRAMLMDGGVEIVEGVQGEIHHYYWAADRYVFPVVQASAAVGIPLSVLEALATGLGVVTTPFDGLRAILGDAWPGVTWGEAGRFVEVVQATLDHGVPETTVAESARARFGLDRVIMEYVGVYDHLLGGGS